MDQNSIKLERNREWYYYILKILLQKEKQQVQRRKVEKTIGMLCERKNWLLLFRQIEWSMNMC